MADGKVVYKVTADTEDAEKQVGKLEKAFTTAGKTLAGVFGAGVTAGVAGIVALTGELKKQIDVVSQYGDKIDKNSQKVGMSYEAYQKWDYVLNLAGSSMDNAAMGVKTLTNTFDAAKNGSKSATATFQRLGMSIEDIQDLSQEDLFGKTIEALQNVEDETERAALANDLFGRSGMELMPLLNQGAEATAAAVAEFENYNMAMSDEAVVASAAFQDSLTKLQGTMDGFKNNMIGTLLPGFTEVTNGFSDLVAGNDGATEAIKAGFESMITSLTEMIPRFIELLMSLAMGILEAAPEIIKALVQGIIETLPELVECITQVITELIATIISMLPDILAMGIELLITLIMGIVEAIPELIAMLPTIITTIVQILMDNIGRIIEAGVQILIALINGLVAAIPELIQMLPSIITTIVSTLLENLPLIIEAAIQIMIALITGLITAIPDLIMALPQIIKAIWEGLQNVDWAGLGKNLLNGIKNGFLSAVSGLWDAVIGAAKRVWQGVKDFLGIRSPSKLFEKTVGIQMIAGEIKGVEEETPDLVDATVESQELMYKAAIDYTVPTSDQLTREMSASLSATNTMTVERTINVPLYLDGREIARATAWDMGEQLAWEAR